MTLSWRICLHSPNWNTARRWSAWVLICLGNHHRLKVIHTPGHDNDCVCWYDIVTKTLITGDSIQANGTPTQGIGFYQSLEKYWNTLIKLENEDIENIICGHDYDEIGSVILGSENVKNCLKHCKKIIGTYQTEIEKMIQSEELTADEIARRLIDELGCGMPENLFLALYTVNEHLKSVKENK